VFSIFILLLIIYSLYSIIGCRFYGEDFSHLFGSFGASMYTLFQVMTLDGWTSMVVQPIMEQYPYAWIYFISFICVTAYILLNAVTSIFVEIMQKSKENNNGKNPMSQNLEDEVQKLREKIDTQNKMIEEIKELLSQGKQ
ncbi:MAG: ion transporter, partial [Fibrobacter sp.]|nr:ion transporter [Fibrobacter sp.]